MSPKRRPVSAPSDLRERQQSAFVEHSILKLAIERIEVSLREAPTISTVELLDRLRLAERRQFAIYEGLRALDRAG